MWKISKFKENQRVVLSISGRIKAEELLELQMAVSSEVSLSVKVDLDLENVRLVDQQVVTYLACCEASGTRLRNCPSYIREWIDREKAVQNDRSNGENLELSCN
jgi:ABC-type transporter Mla MlaB component